MFNKEKYTKFVLSKVKTNEVLYKGSNIYNHLMSAVLQFDQPINLFLSDIPAGRSSEKYRILFDLSNKNNKMHMNTWFLLQFGYKKCACCNNILSIDKFGFDKQRYSKNNPYCINCTISKSTKWNKNNKDKRAKILSKYAQNNRHITRAAGKKWRKNNLDIDAAKTARRRAGKLQATPNWLTKNHLIEIADMYWCAKESERILGYKHHVDHIVPLQGENVCGLHVPWNLQVLTAEENIRKSNTFND